MFRLIVRPTERRDASNSYYARLLANRAGAWEICGVFDLTRSELVALVAICARNGIEITNEVPANPAPIVREGHNGGMS